MAQTSPVAISPQQLAALRVPVRVGWGERSGIAYRATGRAALELIPGATGGEIAGAGHLWPETHPKAFAEFVQACIALR